MDPVPTAFLPASFDPKKLNILHETRVYCFKRSYMLINILNYILKICINFEVTYDGVSILREVTFSEPNCVSN